MTGTAVDENIKNLPEYNDIFYWFFKQVFTSLIDMDFLLKKEHWKQAETGDPGKSPADACLNLVLKPGDDPKVESIDLLSGRLLQYFDFLVANAPWFNGVHHDAYLSVNEFDDKHDEGAATVELYKGLEELYKTEAASVVQDRPKKRRRLIMEEHLAAVKD